VAQFGVVVTVAIVVSASGTCGCRSPMECTPDAGPRALSAQNLVRQAAITHKRASVLGSALPKIEPG
jgi:hypothetical protein